ncbi:MAG TPA: DMT family transporter [Bacteroidales bacterium]|nr:DMT family transporter [Bacteroidales bacterium]
MNRKHQLFVIYPLLTISMILWAYSYIWAKVALAYYGPLTVIFFRTAISAAFMLLVLLATKKQIKVELKHLPAFFLLAFFEPFLYFIGETSGLDKVDASTAAVIISTIPLFTPFAAYYFLREKVSLFNILGIVLSMLGIGYIVFNNQFELQISVEGLLFLSLAVLAALGYSVMIKRLPGNYSVFTVIFWQSLMGAVMFLPLVLIFDYQQILTAGWVSKAVFPIVKLGIFASTIAFMFYMYALKFMKITKVNIFTNMIPVFTIIISWWVLDESVDARRIVGMLVVVAGVFISQIGINRNGNS